MEKSIYSEDYAVFLKHLRAARKKAGMTQTQLARRLGQKQPFVSKIERGERRLDVVEVYRICKILKTDFPAFIHSLRAAIDSLGSNDMKTAAGKVISRSVEHRWQTRVVGRVAGRNPKDQASSGSRE